MSAIWDWFDEFEWEAHRAGDAERARLGELHRQAYRFRESDPDRALTLYAEGRQLAARLREPWWVLSYDQQRVHALLHFKQDYREVLDLAVRNMLEVRKPAYVNFPRRLLIYGDLISAYLGIDPVGHAAAIRQALEHLDSEAPPEGDERYLLLGSRRQFALDRGDLDEAAACGQRSLALAAEDSDRGRAQHFRVFTYSAMAEVAWKRGDWAGLQEAAATGEEVTLLVGHQVELAGFFLWQALLERRAGREEKALRLYRQADQRIVRLGMPPDSSYRDAECAFHEQAGHLDLALAVRDVELGQLRDRGRFFRETDTHLKRCRLLAQLGRLAAADLEAARSAAGRLRQPAWAVEELDRLGSGSGGAP
jgi:hypothetical protein